MLSQGKLSVRLPVDNFINSHPSVVGMAVLRAKNNLTNKQAEERLYSALHKYLHNRQTASAAYWVSFSSKNDKTRSISRWIESKVALATRFICSLDSINNFPNLAFK